MNPTRDRDVLRGTVGETPKGFSPEEARALGDACFEAVMYVRSCGYEAWGDPRARALCDAAVEGMRFCASVLGASPDPADLPRFARWVETLTPMDEYWEEPTSSVIVASLGPALAQVDKPDDRVAALARSDRATVRLALVSALRAGAPGHATLLRKLAADPNPDVRAKARERVAKGEEVPWWRGKFTADPLSVLSRAQQSELGPAITKLSALLDERLAPSGAWAAARPLLDALPDALLVDLASIALAQLEDRERSYELLRALLGRGPSREALWALCAQWQGSTAAALLLLHPTRGLRFASGPIEHRVAQCVALTRRLLATPLRERRAGDPIAPLDGLVFALVAGQWPLEADPTPLLELVLALEPANTKALRASHDASLEPLAEFLAQNVPVAAVPPALWARIEEAHGRSYPGPWAPLAPFGRALIERRSAQPAPQAPHTTNTPRASKPRAARPKRHTP